MDGQNITPRFEFGFGLSYTTFSYSGLSITSSGDDSRLIQFTVTNTGVFAGYEKPQLYLAYPSSAGEPKRVLRGFEEVELDVGVSSSVSFTLSRRDMRYALLLLEFYGGSCSLLILLSVWDTPSQAYVRPTGTFTVYVGASIRDVRLTGTVVI